MLIMSSHLVVLLLIVLVATISAFPTEKYNSYGHDNVQSCIDLGPVVESLLAAGMVPDGQPLETSNLYSVFYPQGLNPTAEELYADIPESAFGPQDDKHSAIASAVGWDVAQVIADQGYGEQDPAIAAIGGLPSFCRFGGQVKTSNITRVLFEVWMPLPDAPPASTVVRSNQPVSAADVSLVDNLSVVFTAKAQGDSFSTVSDLSNNKNNGADNVRRNVSTSWQEQASLAVADYKPASKAGWKKRFVFTVAGGLRGSVGYPELKQALSRYRVAVAGTNMGHFSSGSGSSWLIDNPEAWTDFGHRAVHLSTVITQLAVETFYGPRRSMQNDDSRWKHGFPSYFKGCSTGGRAGMTEAQRYPDDFDGILAGSPAIDYNYLNAWQIHVNSFQANKTSAGYINPTLFPYINQAVLEACDSLDGVVDNVVSDPFQCKPDFAQLIGCSASRTQNCLTDDQLATLANIYTDYSIGEQLIHETVLAGSENAWNITGGVTGKPFPAGPTWFEYQVLGATQRDTSFDAFTQVTPELIAEAQSKDPGGTIAFNTDLDGFFSNNGKLIHTHGLGDQLIPSGSSIRYHRLVEEAADTDIGNHYRLFLIPGMSHCRGGVGPINIGLPGNFDQGNRPLQFHAKYDALLSLMDWVEEERPPQYLIGTSYHRSNQTEFLMANDDREYSFGVETTRLVCPYPQQARLKASHTFSSNQSLAFKCV